MPKFFNKNNKYDFSNILPDLAFLTFIVLPSFWVITSNDFIYTNEYFLIIIIFTFTWLNSFIIYILFFQHKYKKINYKKLNTKKKIITKLTYISSLLIILYFYFTNNIGIISDDIRIGFEGSVAHKIIIINIFLIATYGLSDKFAFFLFLIITILTGWKSIVLYLIIAYINTQVFNFHALMKNLFYIIILLIIFSLINFIRQNSSFNEISIDNIFSINEVITYYLLYGFINYAFNLSFISEISYFLPLNIGVEQVNPTWNVHSGFHKLFNTLGIFGGCIFLIFLRLLGSASYSNYPIKNFLYYVMMLTIIMFHNTMIALSPIVIVFLLFLFIIEHFNLNLFHQSLKNNSNKLI